MHHLPVRSNQLDRLWKKTNFFSVALLRRIKWVPNSIGQVAVTSRALSAILYEIALKLYFNTKIFYFYFSSLNK